MKFTFDLRLGDRTIRIEDDATTEHELWRKLAFWDSLPTSGPNGETDLRFSYRTPQGFEFFALECRSIGQEFKFGQKKDDKHLFPKGWEAMQHGGARDEYEEEPETRRQPPTPPRQASSGAGEDRLANLFETITGLCQFRERADVEAQITKWAKGRRLEDLSNAELTQIEGFATGWLNSTKKQHSRAA